MPVNPDSMRSRPAFRAALTPALPRALARAATACALLAAGLAPGPALASPPTPPLDLAVTAGPADVGHGRLPFAVRAMPRIAADSLTVEVHAPAGTRLARGAARTALGRTEAGRERRADYELSLAPSARRHVYVRVTLVTPDGQHYTRGEDLVARLGPAPPEHPDARTVPDGAGGALAEFDGSPVAPAAARAPAPPVALAPAGTWIASGTFLYRDREQDANGFTGVEPYRPARDVDVQVLDATTNAVLATGATDSTGRFSIPVTDASVRNVKARMVSLSSHTPGLLLDVRNNATQRKAYAVDGPTVPGHDPALNLDFGTTAAEPFAGGEAFNIFDVVLNGTDFFAQLTGALPALRVVVYWESNSTDGTFFQPLDNSVRLRGTEGYDDTVIGHEHGHFIAHNWSRDDTPGGVHYLGDNAQDLRLAWSEGFATWWAGAVRRAYGLLPRPDLYVDTDGAPGAGNLNFSFGYEAPTVPAFGAANEVAVCAALWDVIDDAATSDASPGTDDDGLARPASDPWEVVHDYFPSASVVNASLEDFWDGWFRPGHDHGGASAMADAFEALAIRYRDDAAEPDSTPALAPPVVPDGRPYERTCHPAGDVDEFTIPTVAGHAYVAETTGLLSGANTALSVFAPDGVTVVGTNDDRAASDPSSRVAFVSPAGGAYHARVTRPPGVGRYGSYAFRCTDGPNGAAALVDAAAARGVARAGAGRGVAWGDLDGDGLPDLYVTGLNATTALYRNLGGTFQDVAAAWGAAVPGDADGVALCDYDNDGDLDVFVTTLGPTVLLENQRAETGQPGFVNRTAAAGLLRTLDGRSAAWGDADRDGFADLFVCDGSGQSALFRNRGDGTFEDVTQAAGVAVGGEAVQAAWCDYDHDGDDDLYVVVHGGSSRLFRNRLRETGALTFTDVTSAAGTPGGLASSGCAFGDFDGDGWMDLYVTVQGGPNFLYRNRGDGTFEDVAGTRNVNPNQNSTCAAWADYDDDGDLDLFVGNDAFAGYAGVNLLYESGGGAFSAVPGLEAALPVRGAAWADFDGDLDPDLYVSCDPGAPNRLYVNGLGPHHALAVSLLGRVSNRDGLGATVRVVAGGARQARVVSGCEGPGTQSRGPALFGLGASTAADSLVVDWPSGRRSILTGVPEGVSLVDEASALAVDDPARAAAAPWRIALLPPTPDPAPGGRAAIAYVVPGPAAGGDARASLALYDVRGRRVRTLLAGPLPPGPGRAALDGHDERGRPLGAGVYFAVLRCGALRATRKLVVVGGGATGR